MCDHFGVLAPIYDRLIKLRAPERLISLLDLPALGSLLDAGGGTGRVAAALRGRVDLIVVADLSLPMLRQAAQKNDLRPACTSSEALPFPEGLFDRAIMVDALHHVWVHGETAAELWRVVKPGGRIVIEEPDARTLPVKMIALVEKLALMRSHFLAPAQIAALFPQRDARIRIAHEGYTAWVVIEKLA